MNLATASGLRKRHGRVTALDEFDLTVPSGSIVGLIGPNGSGKSTALRSLTGLTPIDAGELSVLGLDPYRQRTQLMRQVAYIADVGTLPRWMRVSDLLRFVAGVHPAFDLATAQRALSRTDVRATAKVRDLSKGMTVQLHLALVMATSTQLLILDEPTLGLDLLYRQHFYEALLQDYFADGRSIIVSTHELSEVEHILTDVVFINRGKAVLQAQTDSLAERFVTVTAPESQQEALAALQPLRLRRTLRGVEAIYDGIDPERLPAESQQRPSDISSLFVALLGGES
ncbi:MAG: ABC transporter ATP-binding protein [Pseudomonadota bacterium]